MTYIIDNQLSIRGNKEARDVIKYLIFRKISDLHIRLQVDLILRRTNDILAKTLQRDGCTRTVAQDLYAMEFDFQPFPLSAE